jgi:hypothetical protein
MFPEQVQGIEAGISSWIEMVISWSAAHRSQTYKYLGIELLLDLIFKSFSYALDFVL